MPPLKSDIIYFEFRTTKEVRKRLEHHAKRLAMSMNSIVRDSLLAKIEDLDEKERQWLNIQEVKRTGAPRIGRPPRAEVRKPGIAPLPAKIPRLPTLGSSSSSSSISSVYASDLPIPEKLAKSFARWADYIEAGRDKADSESRAKEVYDEISDRTSSEGEAKACCDKLKEFITDRFKSRTDSAITFGSVNERV